MMARDVYDVMPKMRPPRYCLMRQREFVDADVAAARCREMAPRAAAARRDY